LFVIADISRVWVLSRAYERDLKTIQVGVPATVTVKAFPDERWEGKVDYVSPMLDEHTRTAEVRVELENDKGLLRPGMFGIVSPENSHSGEKHEALAVPTSALQRDGESWVAFVPKTKNSFERRLVTVGTRGIEFVEVLSGLGVGEQVVSAGTFILKSEAAKHEMGGGHSH
jgi:RND family efflux transporter MFP subunit